VKNKCLEELRDTKSRYEEEKKKEKEEMQEIEMRMRQKSTAIDDEKHKQEIIVRFDNVIILYR